LKQDEKIQKEQIARLRRYKNARDATKLKKLVEVLEEAAAKKDNLMPQILASVENGMTLGEISGTLRQIFGVYDRS
jgi:methylmalonyl-CoA mutase, N-terminal domain